MRLISLAVLLCFNSIIYVFGQATELPIKVEIDLLREFEMRYEKKVIGWQFPEYDVEIPGDSAKLRYYTIEVLIENTSSVPIYIWLMSCSWTDNFIINNDYMFFGGMKCDKNSPVIVEIMPAEAKRYIAELIKHIKFDYPGDQIFDYGVEATKVGLVVVNDVYQDTLNNKIFHMGMLDKSKWKIVWSNPLQLHQFRE